MKTFITILLALINFISFSQDKIILIENSEVINCEILCITETQYIFKVENKKRRIEKSKVSNFILYDYDNRFSKLCDGFVGLRVSKEIDSAKNHPEDFIPVAKRKTTEKSIILTKTELNSNEKIHYYSGLELQKYTKHNRIGLGLTIGGGFLSYFGSNLNANNPSQKSGRVFMFLGGATAIVGTCFLLEAPKHIKNAGLILSGNGVGVKISF